MTPAIELLRQRKVSHFLHQYVHDSCSESYGQEAAIKLNIDAARVFKTLVIELSTGDLAVGVVPVTCSLNMKSAAKQCKSKKAMLAKPQQVERSTGYVLGGVSPLAQKKPLFTLIDSSALEFETLFVSAGKRGLEIEIAPRDLASLSKANFANIADLDSPF